MSKKTTETQAAVPSQNAMDYSVIVQDATEKLAPFLALAWCGPLPMAPHCRSVGARHPEVCVTVCQESTMGYWKVWCMPDGQFICTTLWLSCSIKTNWHYEGTLIVGILSGRNTQFMPNLTRASSCQWCLFTVGCHVATVQNQTVPKLRVCMLNSIGRTCGEKCKRTLLSTTTAMSTSRQHSRIPRYNRNKLMTVTIRWKIVIVKKIIMYRWEYKACRPLCWARACCLTQIKNLVLQFSYSGSVKQIFKKLAQLNLDVWLGIAELTMGKFDIFFILKVFK